MPKKTSAAAPRVSLKVGCGWMVSTRSPTAAPISMANTASEIRSPAPAPTMPQPSRRSFAGSMIHLVRPSVRPTACARPLAAQGNWATETARFCRSASVCVNPAQAISGSVKTTAGMAGREGDGMAGKRLDGRLSLVRRLVRQHRLARGVADGEDVRVTGAALAVDDEEALRIDGDVGVLQAEAVAVRPPAHGEKDAAELPHLLDAVGLEGGFDCILLVDQAEEFRARVDRLELLLESFVQRADEVAIDAGQQAVGHLDHGDAAAQRGVHGAHFQANVAAANHQQRLRRVDQLQGRGGIHDPRSRQIEGGNPRRPRTRRDDAMLEANAVVGQGLSVDGRQSQRLRVLEGGLGADDLHLSLAADLLQTGGERGDDLFFLRGGLPAGSSAAGRRRPRLRGVSLRP